MLHKITGSAVPIAIATLMIGLLRGDVAVRLTRRSRQRLSDQLVPGERGGD